MCICETKSPSPGGLFVPLHYETETDTRYPEETGQKTPERGLLDTTGDGLDGQDPPTPADLGEKQRGGSPKLGGGDTETLRKLEDLIPSLQFSQYHNFQD